MRKARFLMLPCILLVFAGLAAQTPPVVHYVLLEESTYQEGCFDPCMCPILQPLPMGGSFDLELLPTNGPLDTYAVTNVDWSVPILEKAITGVGFYRRGGDLQELSVDLSINADGPTTFTSGTTDNGSLFPLIDLTIDMNDLYCYDIVMHVRAAPAPTPGPYLSVESTTLSWTSPAGTDGYDVVCGDLNSLIGTGDFGVSTDLCLADGHPGTSLDYSLAVGPGDGVWFLVRGDLEGGSYDSGSESQLGPRDAAIGASTVSCP